MSIIETAYRAHPAEQGETGRQCTGLSLAPRSGQHKGHRNL